MRQTVRRLVTSVLGLAAAFAVGPASALSPYLEPVPASGPCDVVMTPSNATASLALLNDPDVSVFCVDPGDYRSLGKLVLSASGTQSKRRFLRYNAADGVVNAVQRPQQAIFEWIWVSGSWWVVQGVTVLPRSVASYGFLSILGGDHNLIDGNLVDAMQQMNTGGQAGILIGAWNNAEPATYNTIQRNVVRNGNQRRRAVDYAGVVIFGGNVTGSNNDFNRILDNEIYDWGDGVALASSATCDDPGRPHGTVIDGNDVYITGAKRIRCVDGAADPNGDCSCSENGIDVKPDPGPDPALWTRVTNNRLWGFRPVRDPSYCGGQGAYGQAITAGNLCTGHLLVAGNVVTDSTVGVAIGGSHWILAGNLFYDIRKAEVDRPIVPVAIFEDPQASELQIEFNTVVGVDNSYDDGSDNTDTRCNAVIDDLNLDWYMGPRGSGHLTEDNFLYHSARPWANFVGSTNELFPAAVDSKNSSLCFLRKRLTTPEWFCVPFGRATPQSPHSSAGASCNPELLAPFGLAPVSYDSILAVRGTACGLGSELAFLLPPLLWMRQRRRGARA